jgi:GDP-4-dehydro-6-deoxy-D-mannose reductase
MTPDRILLTGAEGFVGRHLRAALHVAFPGAALLPTARTATGACQGLDVTDTSAVVATVAAFRPTACIHLAAVSMVAEAQRAPGVAWQTNLHGTLALAEAIKLHAPGCLFVFASSSEIYGRTFAATAAKRSSLDETALPAPMNLYAAIKAAADLALGAMAGDGLCVVRLRVFNHTGPGQQPTFVVPAFARQIARIEAGLQTPSLAVGALDPMRDFLDVRDVCAAYVACLRRATALAPGTVLNIASGVPRRIGDILAELMAQAGLDVPVEMMAGLLRHGDIPRASGDAGQAQRLLGWAPRIDWTATLQSVLDDWRMRVRATPCRPAAAHSIGGELSRY